MPTDTIKSDNPEDSSNSPVISVDERARLPRTLQIVGVSRTTWLELVKNKEAPQPVKIGRSTGWLLSELQEFLSKNAAKRGGI